MVVEFTKKYDLTDSDVVKDLIFNSVSGMYGTVNEDGEKVMVFIQNSVGLDVRTFQHNGWLRVNFYNKNGYCEGETFEGRWNIE